MKRTLLFFALALLTTSVLLTGCKKDENPADGGSGGNTQTGAGTMSAKIDGQDWSASSPISSIPAANAGYVNNTLVITGTNYLAGTSITITINNVTSTGEFRVGLSNNINFPGFAQYAAGLQAWVTTDTETGTVKITKFDTQNKIVSGTFSFRCRAGNNVTPEIRNITDGRFDVKWQ